MSKRDNIIKWTVISIFVGLYVMVSAISTIHVIDFFRLSNPEWLAITLAIAFEIGAAASLAAIIILDKTSKSLVWLLFILITLMQMMGNMYFAYTHLTDYKNWSELFGLIEEEPIFQKRVLSIVSGAILPIIALGFIKSLVDYIRPSTVEEIKEEYETKKAIEEEIAREAIDEFVPTNEEDLAEIEKIKTEIAKIESNDEISDKEKSRKTEQKIAKAIAKNPELKKQIEEKIREIDEEDTYTKSETNVEETIAPPTVKFGGM
jgi:uncharacterized membrane protein